MTGVRAELDLAEVQGELSSFCSSANEFEEAEHPHSASKKLRLN